MARPKRTVSEVELPRFSSELRVFVTHAISDIKTEHAQTLDAATSRLAKALAQPGLRKKLPGNAPVFRAHPTEPKLLIRMLGGKRDVVRVTTSGKFSVVK